MQLITTDAPAVGKFSDPRVTSDGKPRARVDLRALKTLWFNTGTLCNLTCENCYIESSPRNDRLTYLTRDEVASYLAEVRDEALGVTEIGLTGGEPFMNPEIVPILETCLAAGFTVLLLTNAMRPMMKVASGLRALHARFGNRLAVRVSIDHHDRELHEAERGKRSWQPMLDGLKWLSDNGFRVHVAGRRRWGDSDDALRRGFGQLFARLDVDIDATDPEALVLFPEMDGDPDVPEITTDCWGLLGVEPGSLMCASARMVVKRKGADHPEVVACTLLPYDPAFSFGRRLVHSLGPVALNHPHCATFCVLGGGSCSA